MHDRYPSPEDYDFVRAGDLVDMFGWFDRKTGKNRGHEHALVYKVHSTRGERGGRVSAAIDIITPDGEMVTSVIVEKHCIIPAPRDKSGQ